MSGAEKGGLLLSDGQAVGFRVVFAVSAWARLRGLLARRPSWLGRCGVLVLAPCGSIHTFGMRRPIDVAFVACDGTVLLSRRGLAPCRKLRCRGARIVLERFTPDEGEQVFAWPRAGQRLFLSAGAGQAQGQVLHRRPSRGDVVADA